MTIVLIVIIYLYNVVLLYKSTTKDINFIYSFIVCNLISNLVLSLLTEEYGGILFPIRLLQMITLILFIFKMGIKNILIIKIILSFLIILLIFHPDIGGLSLTINIVTYLLLFTASILLSFDDNFDSKIIKLSKSIIVLCTIYIITTVSFGIGTEMYSADFTVGALSMDRMNIVSFSYVVIFFYIFNNKIKKINIIYLILSILLLLSFSKRLPILLILVGMFLIIIQRKINYKKYILTTIVLFLILFIINIIVPDDYSITKRGNRGSFKMEVIEKEGRFIEYLVFPKYITQSRYSTLLFGNGFGDVFGYCYKYFGLNRAIHTGMIHLIYASGIFGFFLFFSFFVILFISIKKLLNYSKNYIRMESLTSVYLGFPLLTLLIVYNFIDAVFKQFPSLIVFVILGKIYGDSQQHSNKVMKLSRNEE